MPVKIFNVNELLKCDTQTRTHIRQATVDEYASLMAEGHIFPRPIVYQDGDQLFLASGFHRISAMKKLGQLNVECEVLVGSKVDALEAGIKENAKHQGERLSKEDCKYAAKQLLIAKPEFSNRRIAELTGISDKTVSKIRDDLEASGEIIPVISRIGKDGRERSIDSSGDVLNYPRLPDPGEALFGCIGEEQNLLLEIIPGGVSPIKRLTKLEDSRSDYPYDYENVGEKATYFATMYFDDRLSYNARKFYEDQIDDLLQFLLDDLDVPPQKVVWDFLPHPVLDKGSFHPRCLKEQWWCGENKNLNEYWLKDSIETHPCVTTFEDVLQYADYSLSSWKFRQSGCDSPDTLDEVIDQQKRYVEFRLKELSDSVKSAARAPGECPSCYCCDGLVLNIPVCWEHRLMWGPKDRNLYNYPAEYDCSNYETDKLLMSLFLRCEPATLSTLS